MNNTYFLKFHIGPVQDFISTARRTQDWWMGSWLLAHLSRFAMEQVGEDNLVLPKELPNTTDPTIADTPNHFLARLPSDQAQEIAKTLQTTVKTTWTDLAHKVYQFLNKPGKKTVDQALWDRQVDDFLEIYWTLVPDDGSAATRNTAQLALDARKRLRDFEYTEERDLKCTLCGARQELSKKKYSGEARQWWATFVKSHHGKVRVRETGSERLCAVCMIKRAALPAKAIDLKKEDGHYPSTSSVASAMFRKRLLESGTAKDELEIYFDTLKDDLGIKQQTVLGEGLPLLQEIAQQSPLSEEVRDGLLQYDGDLFYAEIFTEQQMTDEYPQVKKFPEEELREKLKDSAYILREVFSVADEKPSKYFATLQLDGDHMGKFYNKASEEEAGDVSQNMSAFAREQARQTVESHCGRLVYAGGDDALALLPVESLLPCARQLQHDFREAVHRVKLTSGIKLPTVSIGAVVAHHTAPLDGVLQALNQATHAAKARAVDGGYDRDAFCLRVLKRSGEEIQVGTKWNYDEVDVLDILQRTMQAFRKDILSMKFAQLVVAEVRGMGFSPSHDVPVEDTAWAAELRRLARRHSEKPHRAQAEALAEKLATWVWHTHDFGTVANYVSVARFLVKVERGAE